MIDAYVVRDPQGRVIGMSANDHYSALGDAFINKQHDIRTYDDTFMGLAKMFQAQGSATVYGYTIKREQVAL
jgi:hypothetical protein